MTKEQAQNLKKGDKIRLTETLTVLDPCCNGNEDILADTPSGHLVFVEPHEAQLADPAPKYDPNRKFREGDEVRPIVHKGRIFSLYWKKYIGKNLTVTKSEDAFNLPEVNGQPIDPAYLELVTPVEELRPYFISEGAGIIEIWNRKREVVKTWYYGAVKAGVEALAAAEAERDRLNAEYRKEQDNE